MEIIYLTPLERERAEYGLRTLKHLKQELEHSPCGNQFEKYPFDIGGLSWITREIKREETLLGDNRSLDFWLEAERIYDARRRSIPRNVP